MSALRGTTWVGAVAAVLALSAAACGGPKAVGPAPPATPAAPSAANLPARPVQLRLDDVNPCDLLTGTQRAQLNVAQGSSAGSTYSGPLQGPICVWPSRVETPDNEWSGGAILNHGAEYAAGKEPLRTVDGFAATTTGSTGTDPAYYCLMLVDVAPSQALAAAYGNDAHDAPGMNHNVACDKAQELVQAMLTTLRAKRGH